MNISNLPDIKNSPNAVSTQQAALATSKAKPPVELIKDQSLSLKEITEVVQQANEAMRVSNSNLKFMLDPENGQAVVQIIDQETQTVLKQIPSVEMLKLAKALEKMQGVLMSKEA